MASKLDRSPARQRGDLAEVAIATVAGLALALVILFIFAVPLARNLAASRDFVSYWATGRQLVLHANPYDSNSIANLEQSAGLKYKVALLMRNPPWALPLVYPLGFLSTRIAATLWTLLLLASLLLCIAILHRLYGSPSNHIHWLGFAFTPAIICLTMGQTSLFALLGLVLFLRLHRPRPFAAGAALWLCALKPHLFLPFAAALAAWVVVSRSYKLLAGAVSALALSSAAAYAMAPSAWADYLRMMRSPAVENDFIPCLAVLTRQWIRPQTAWLQYLPAALCCVWAIFYFWRRRTSWDWLTSGSPLILVSLLAAPYCWLYDQCLAVPALLHGAYVTRSRTLLAALAALILLMDIEICVVRVSSTFYLWTAPIWLVWYLMARASADQAATKPVAAPA